MSTSPAAAPAPKRKKMTIPMLMEKKKNKEPIVQLAVYDYENAIIADRLGIDILCVSDTGGMVLFGHESTTSVSFEEVMFMAQAVKRGSQYGLRMVDMPYMSFHLSPQQSVDNAAQYVAKAGAEVMKCEGNVEGAKTVEPDADYVLPFGKANVVLNADNQQVRSGKSLVVVTYGMGVHWALNAAKGLAGQIEIVDLRTLFPLDEALVFEAVRRHGRCLVVTEEAVSPSFAQSLAGRIQEACFADLDAPVRTLGAPNVPAVPLNEVLERAMIPSVEKVAAAMVALLAY